MKHKSFVYTQLNDQTVLFLTIQFGISHLFGYILNFKQVYLTYRSGATIPGERRPGSDINKETLRIP